MIFLDTKICGSFLVNEFGSMGIGFYFYLFLFHLVLQYVIMKQQYGQLAANELAGGS